MSSTEKGDQIPDTPPLEPEAKVSVGGNTLLIGDKPLDLVKDLAHVGKEISAEQLRKALQTELARWAIIDGLIASYRVLEQKQQEDPDLTISVPPLFVIRLAKYNQAKKIITPEGLGGYPKTGNKSHYREIEEIKPRYQAYWKAVSENGFRPHVLTGYGDRRGGGIYLMLNVAEWEIEAELNKG